MKNKNKSNKKAAGAAGTRTRTASAAQKITKRIVDVQRHTQGYIVGGKELSVPQARKLAAAGRIRGVQVVGKHIQSMPGRKRLSSLPMMIKK